MVVCHCTVVNDRAVSESIHNGAHTVAAICRSTGAGRDCGACVFSLKRLLCEQGRQAADQTPEVHVAAS